MIETQMSPEALSNWTDEYLLAAWNDGEWKAGDPVAIALRTEIDRRGLIV